ncbi:hypothetical protein C2G38_2158320 [Gigaspora rosea]|uniref:SAM domain-containing protein n=1 Tax=Gigaspora rosea TaxID=44941 RepID=A0A397W4S6_9GLOM|nr:hypothetical protein C2G38_2158320 [Gigaspora rosea]
MNSAIKELNIEELIQFLKRENLDLKETNYEILRKEEISGSIFSNFTLDEFLRMGLPFGPAKTLENFIQKIKTQRLKPYSSYKTGKDLVEILKEHGIIGTSIGDIPQFTPEPYNISEYDDILNLCMTNLKHKLSILGALVDDDNEAKRCEYVKCILDSEIIIVKRITRKQVTRYSQVIVTEKDNTRIVEYVIKYLSELISITEGRFWKMTEGFIQNLIQFQNAFQVNKHIISNAFEEKDYIYGIVTTADVWYFLKYSNKGVFCTSKNPHKFVLSDFALNDPNEELILRNHVKRVIEVIVGLLIDKLENTEPPIKKVKTNK